jgi:hypothetical protein
MVKLAESPKTESEGKSKGFFKTHGVYPKPELVIHQIKEKLGTLRIYYSLTQPTPNYHERFDKENLRLRNEYLHGIIRGLELSAEDASSKTCEITGKAGSLDKTGGWWRTLCKEESDKRGNGH